MIVINAGIGARRRKLDRFPPAAVSAATATLVVFTSQLSGGSHLAETDLVDEDSRRREQLPVRHKRTVWPSLEPGWRRGLTLSAQPRFGLRDHQPERAISGSGERTLTQPRLRERSTQLSGWTRPATSSDGERLD